MKALLRIGCCIPLFAQHLPPPLSCPGKMNVPGLVPSEFCPQEGGGGVWGGGEINAAQQGCKAEEVAAGEDTDLAPLVPSLLKALEGSGGSIHFEAVAAVGERYVKQMRERFANRPSPERIVDKMLRNSWNVGYIAFMLPEVCDTFPPLPTTLPLLPNSKRYRLRLLNAFPCHPKP